MLEAKPNVLKSSNTIIFMFFWKELRLPNYAELKIIMVHKDKNGKSDAGSPWQPPDMFKSHLFTLVLIF